MDDGGGRAPLRPSVAAVSEQPSFEVSTETLHVLSARVGQASAAVAALRADPSVLTGDVARAGSPPLVAAAEAFARAWAHGCQALERDTSLMSDMLRRAGDAYEVDEQRTRDALVRWRSVGGPVDGLEGL